MRGVIEEIYQLPPTEPSIENQVVDLLFEQVFSTEQSLLSRKQFLIKKVQVYVPVLLHVLKGIFNRVFHWKKLSLLNVI